MAIRSKQQGYSTESQLLYEILKQLDKLTKVIANAVVTTTTTTTTV